MCCLQADTYCIPLVFFVLMHRVSCSVFHSTDQPIINFCSTSLCTLSPHWWILFHWFGVLSLLMHSVLKRVFVLQRSPCAPTTTRSTSSRKMGPSGLRSMSWRSTMGRWQVRHSRTLTDTVIYFTFVFVSHKIWRHSNEPNIVKLFIL